MRCLSRASGSAYPGPGCARIDRPRFLRAIYNRTDSMRVVWDAREQRDTPYSGRREMRAGLLREDPVERETGRGRHLLAISVSLISRLNTRVRVYSLERFFEHAER